MSFAGELQTAPFYPFALLAGLFATPGDPYATDILYCFHFLLAALGVHLLARHLGLKFVASLIAALIFTYGGAFSQRVTGQPNLFMSFAWMPWVILFTQLALGSRLKYGRLVAAMAAGIATALAFLAGHAHSVVLTLIAVAILSPIALKELDGSKARLWRLLTLAGTAGLVSLGLVLPQLVATREYLKLAYKWYGPGATQYPHVVPFDNFQASSLKLADLHTLFTPLNSTAFDVSALFFTLTGLVCAIVAIDSARWSDRIRLKVLCLSGLMLFSLAFAFSAIPVLGHIFYHVPIVNLVRLPTRAAFLFVLAGALLAGLGFDEIVRLLRGYVSRVTKTGAGLIPWIVSLVVVPFVVIEVSQVTSAYIKRPFTGPNRQLEAILSAPIVAKLVKLSNQQPLIYRYYGSREDVPPNIGDVHPVLSTHGFRSSRPRPYHHYFNFDPFSDKMDKLAVKWWASRKPVDGLPLIATFGEVKLYERPSALPVFWMVGEDGKPQDAGIQSIDWNVNDVVVTFRSPIEGTLVFAQTDYPGFRATADGADLPMGLHEELMSMNLSSPAKQVRLFYDPDWFVPSIWVLATTLLLSVTAMLVLGIRMIRQSKP